MQLCTQERIVAWRLREGRCVSVNELVNAFYGEKDGPDWALKIVYLRVASLRMKLPAHITIRNCHGVGYEVDPRCLKEFSDLIVKELKDYLDV